MVFDPSAQPVTIAAGKTAAQVVTFRMPAGVALKAESIVASINAAGAESFPELTIKAPGGAVIARKAQRDGIPAGDTGDATWALRLDDAAAGGDTGSGQTEYGFYGVTNLSHPNTGLQNLTMDLQETSDAAIFDTNGGYARVQPGVYNLFAYMDFDANQTFGATPPNVVEFGMTFDAFPFFTLGLISQILPYTAADPITVRTMHYHGMIICDVATKFRLNLRSVGGVARGIGDATLAAEKIRSWPL